MPDKQVREQDKFVLRMPDGLRERIATVARANARSMNAEIVQVLTEHYPPQPSDEELLNQIEIFLTWAQDSQSTAFRLPLLETLRDLSTRMAAEAGCVAQVEAKRAPTDVSEFGENSLHGPE